MDFLSGSANTYKQLLFILSFRNIEQITRGKTEQELRQMCIDVSERLGVDLNLSAIEKSFSK